MISVFSCPYSAVVERRQGVAVAAGAILWLSSLPRLG
jgi:hypothetical protein